MVNSFTPTALRIPQLRTIQSTKPSSSCTHHDNAIKHTSSSLQMAHGQYGNGRSSSRYASANERTKRQERVGHVVRSELATILNRGTSIKNDNEPIEGHLRRRINIVHSDVSPDLRHARITVSIMAGQDKKLDTIAKRRAYAWLVRNTKAIRFSLAQKMKHMKGGSPELTFVQVDVGAAVDVMQLIEKVSEGYKRDDVLEMGFEEEWDEEGDDDDGWFDFDEEGDGVSVEVEV